MGMEPTLEVSTSKGATGARNSDFEEKPNVRN